MNRRTSQHSETIPSLLTHHGTMPVAYISLLPWPSCSQNKGPKAPWQPKSWPVKVCCRGVDSVELHSQTFALVNQENRRGADTQSGSLPQTGDKPPPLLLWGASSQCIPICLHLPLQHSLCSIHVGDRQRLCSMHVSSFSPPFILLVSALLCCLLAG